MEYRVRQYGMDHTQQAREAVLSFEDVAAALRFARSTVAVESAEAANLHRISNSRPDDVWILTDRDGEEWVELSAFADHEAALRRFREILAVDTSYTGAAIGPYDEGSDARLIFAAVGSRVLMLHNPRLT